jgi:hypothetical protein
MKEQENKDIVDNADKLATEILAQKKNNKYRDHFFPLMIDKLGLKIGVEIGVDKGDFSKNVMDRSDMRKYYCIDTWQDDFGSDHKPDYFDKDGGVRFNQAKDTLSKYIRDQKLMMIRKNSLNASKYFGPESIDFCYIDGDHSLGGIYTDLMAWTPKVKVGGIIAGHDYKDGPKSGIADFSGKQLPYRIKSVTSYYGARYGYKINSVGGKILSFWFIKNRKVEDPFWEFLNEREG